MTGEVLHGVYRPMHDRGSDRPVCCCGPGSGRNRNRQGCGRGGIADQLGPPAERRQRRLRNDRLQTGRGNVQIVFIDNTKLVVGPNSVLVIDRFLMRGGNRPQKFSVDALRGSFRFITGNGAKSAYDIQTANATIGIRGTAFDFSTGRETLLAVFEGGVRLCAGGRCESIPEGCGVGRARGNGVGELGWPRQGTGSALASLYRQSGRSLPAIPRQHPVLPCEPERAHSTRPAEQQGGRCQRFIRTRRWTLADLLPVAGNRLADRRAALAAAGLSAAAVVVPVVEDLPKMQAQRALEQGRVIWASR